MFSFIEESKSIFGHMNSYYEAIAEVLASFTTQIKDLPTVEKLEGFIENFSGGDELEISMKSISDFRFKNSVSALWNDAYNTFLSDGTNEPDDVVKVNIKIKKNTKSGIVYVYSYKYFCEFLSQKSIIDVMRLFVGLFADRNSIRFNVLDERISTYTKTIAFTSKENNWPLEVFDRNKALSKCEEASLFLNRNEIKLLPDDFSITSQATGDDVVKQLLRKLDTIMSYVYVANNSYVADDKIVVQFDPAGKGFDKKLNDVGVSSAISRIYQYVYGSDTAVERAGIARNIISLNCKSDDQIWNIDDEIISSIKSNFTLYQKSAVEKYIEAKNKISDYIIDTSKQIQEMTYELAEGLRNNFIAVIMFLITVILTDSMDWDDLLSGGIPRDIVYMSYLFAATSFVYWLITILGTYRKWTYCADGYNRLKDNYKDLLEKKDLNKAFGNDEVKNKAKKQIIRDAIIVSVIWIAFLVAMVWFFTWMKVQVVPVP